VEFFTRKYGHLLYSLSEKGDAREREDEPILLKPIINDSCPCITFHKEKNCPDGSTHNFIQWDEG
jgi:hypothetical protein